MRNFALATNIGEEFNDACLILGRVMSQSRGIMLGVFAKIVGNHHFTINIKNDFLEKRNFYAVISSAELRMRLV